MKMKFKKLAARKKAESPMDTMEDEYNDDECSNGNFKDNYKLFMWFYNVF